MTQSRMQITMRNSRIFIDAALTDGALIQLPADTTHYLRRVLRVSPGDAFVVFDGRGNEHHAEVVSLSSKGGSARVGAKREAVGESPLSITLIQGLCRGQRMDFCIQKATELGVRRIVAARMDRSVVRLDTHKTPKRLAHWRAIAIAACEQSGRANVPVIECTASLAEAIDAARGDLVMLDASGAPYANWQEPVQPVSLVVGPEGGYSEAERQQLGNALRWRLGPRVLRTETAGMVALTLAQGRWGDLG